MKSLLLSKFLLISICLLSSLLFSNNASSQVFPQWISFYNYAPAGQRIAINMVPDDFGNVYVTGSVPLYSSYGSQYDIVTVKYNSSGSEEWVARYEAGFAHDIAVDKTGNVYVTGGCYDTADFTEMVTIKYNNAGVQQWVARIPGRADEYGRGYGDGVKVDKDGNVYVTGNSGAYYACCPITIKYNSLGEQQWVQNTSGAMAIDPVTSDVYIAGSTEPFSGPPNGYLTTKYNSQGVEQWARKYEYGTPMGSPTYPTGIGLDANGNVYITGIEKEWRSTTIKYDPSGNMQWIVKNDGPYFDQFPVFYQRGFGVDSSGNVYVTGWSPVNDIGIGFRHACVTFKYNSAGVQQWMRLYNSSTVPNSKDEGNGLALDDEGNSYISVLSDTSGTYTSPEYLIMKYNSEGVQQWIKRFGAGSEAPGMIGGVCVNKSRDLFVSGSVLKNPGAPEAGYDYPIIRYIQPKPLVVTASPDTTIYYGYGSNCVQLKAAVSGGMAPYTFTWLTGGTIQNNSSTTVCPTSTTVYKVIVRDAIGTSDTTQVNVKVVDIRCGDKVIVCHNGKELCIAPQAAVAHLQHGDKLGSCSMNASDCDKLNDITSAKRGVLPFIFKASPNPFGYGSTLFYELPLDAQVTIALVDLNGREIKTLVREKKTAGYYSTVIDGKKLVPGTYVCRMVISASSCQSVHTLKLIVVK